MLCACTLVEASAGRSRSAETAATVESQRPGLWHLCPAFPGKLLAFLADHKTADQTEVHEMHMCRSHVKGMIFWRTLFVMMT